LHLFCFVEPSAVSCLRTPSLTAPKSFSPPRFLRKEHNLDQSEQEKEYHRPERRTNQESDESVKGQLEEAEQKAPEESAYDSYNQINNQTGSSSSYNLFGQKTRDKTYYQEPNQGLNCHV